MSYSHPIERKELVSDQRTLPVASPAPRPLSGRLSALARQAILAWQRDRAARASARALARLSDRQLRDIGIDRGSIPEVARAAAWAHLTVAGLDTSGQSFDARF